jgi:aminoglycoside N3'-acetyltransferase
MIKERAISFVNRGFSPQNQERAKLIYRCIYNIRQTYKNPIFKPVPVEDIRNTLETMGITQGDIIHVHSSISYLSQGGIHSSHGSDNTPWSYANKIINTLIDIVGNNGTILMNTDALGHQEKRRIWTQDPDAFIFDYKKSPSRRGLISELFRRREDTLRSVHPWYNVTGWGKLASEMIKDHKKSTPYAMDVHSPWYKLHDLNGKVVLLGNTFDVNSPLHFAEYMHPKEFPRAVFLNKPVTMRYVDTDRQIKETEILLHAPIWYDGAPTQFSEYLNQKYRIYKIREFGAGTRIVCYNAADQYKAVYAEMKKNVTWYDPQFSPKKLRNR